MDENELKTKWCPHARLRGSGLNRFSDRPVAKENRCLGSLCSQYREMKFPINQQETPTRIIAYCGLAGKP